MKDDEDRKCATIIPFPTRKLEEGTIPDKISLSEDGAFDLILAMSSINMATRYKGEFNEDCQKSMEAENFPCSENCGCYLHMLSSMALEVIFDGPRKDEARDALRQEHATLKREGPKDKGEG